MPSPPTKSSSPTEVPTPAPTTTPTSSAPSFSPTSAAPTSTPSTISPSRSPSFQPTISPSFNPTVVPSKTPTLRPSLSPTSQPSTSSPTFVPTISPTGQPSFSHAPQTASTSSSSYLNIFGGSNGVMVIVAVAVAGAILMCCMFFGVRRSLKKRKEKTPAGVKKDRFVSFRYSDAYDSRDVSTAELVKSNERHGPVEQLSGSIENPLLPTETKNKKTESVTLLLDRIKGLSHDISMTTNEGFNRDGVTDEYVNPTLWVKEDPEGK